MANQKLSLTRDQFASFLSDFEQIKQFERLFANTNINSISIDDVSIAAGNAGESANDALAQIVALSETLNLAPPGNLGTVTSVAASGGTTGLTFSGSPITTSGTLTLGGTLAVANGGTGATNATDARLNLSAAKSGANSDITSLSGITGSISTVDSITFDTAAAITVGQGQIAWNADDGTIDIGMGYDAVTQQVGLEQYFRIKASATITDGQCIMFTGSVGASGVLKGAPATGVTNPQYVMGVATMDIANNGFGYVTSFGLVRGINTTGSSVGETWVDGDILYYNPAFTGGLTKVPPTAPLPKIIVAAVVNAGPGASGSLFIRVQGEPDLHNLSDVYAPSPISNGQILIGDGPQARWEATTLTPGSGVSITNAAGAITISATGSGGTVTSVSVVSANGFAGTVATSTTTPAITLSTSVNGIIKGNGTALSAAVAATDYVAPSAYASANGLTMSTSRLLGRTTASTGAAEEISVAGGLTLSGGVLTGASGTVTSVTGTSPVVSSGGTTPAISMPAATTSVNGYLTSTDWTTFNNKGSGTVTSVSGTGTVNGITLTGTVTSSGSLTLGGTLSGVSLTTQVSGTLPIANGGTNGTSAPTAGAVPYGTGTAYAFSAVGTSGQVLTSAGAGVPTWTTPTTGTVTSVTGTAPVVSSGGATPAISMAAATTSVSGYLTSTDWTTFNGKQATLVSGTNIKTVGGVSLLGSGDVGTIGAAYGGTGQSSYTVGDILFASATTTLSKLADVATGNAIISGGVGVAPSYGKIGLTTHISGTLPVANGGTGTATAFTAGSVVFAGASGVYAQDNANLFWDDTNNRLGIGTATPVDLLQIYRSSGTGITSGISLSTAAGGVGDGSYIKWLSAVTAEKVARIDGVLEGTDVGSIRFNTGNGADGFAERGRFDASGNFLVGTTAAEGNGKVVSVSTVSANPCYASRNSAGASYFINAAASAIIGSITNNADTGVLYNVTSDVRLKENIANADDASSLIDNLQVRKFDWKNSSSHQRYGFVAQELLEVAPEAVYQPENPEDMMAVDYSKLVPMLVKEIQSLRARVAKLEGE